MSKGVIYYLHCLPTNKGYVGQSVKHDKRWQVHINAATKENPALPIHRAIKKYGVESFTAEVIRVCAAADLNRLETFYIKKLKTFVEHPEGGGFCQPAKEVVARRSAALRKAYANDPTLRQRTGGSHKGKTVSAETRARISDAHKGVPLSETHKEALRASHASAKRKATHTPLWSAKVSASLLARYATDQDLRHRLSEAHKGKTFLAEHRLKLSETRKRTMATMTVEERKAFAAKGVQARLTARL